MLTKYDVAGAAQAACLLEAAANKPGNVNRHKDFRDLFLEDFLLSALAIGRHMENAHQKTVGETILGAVKSTREIVGTNTNLGIILLFSPLAKAYGKAHRSGGGGGNLRNHLNRVLLSLTVEDNINVYDAINIAAAGGMGKVKEADVSTKPAITLYESMNLARERDSIAREYVTGYEITFGLAKPYLESLLNDGCALPRATVQLFLKLLAEVPDTLIARKVGPDKAGEISDHARAIVREGGMATEAGTKMVFDLDKHLRSRGNKLNPGTTADLTATALFVYFLEQGLQKWKDVRPTVL